MERREMMALGIFGLAVAAYIAYELAVITHNAMVIMAEFLEEKLKK